MSPKTFAGLAVLTLVTLVAAIVAAVSQPATSTVPLSNEVAFPKLRDQPQAVAKITVKGADGSFSLVRDKNGAWTIPQRDGYSADTKKVQKLVVQMTGMRLVEPKTHLKERFARLHVQDPDVKGAKSHLVRLLDGDGKVLAEAIFGKRSWRRTGREKTGIYMRRPGGDRAWLASGGYDVEGKPGDWLDKAIVNIPREDIRSVAFAPGGGKGYSVARADAASNFSLAAMPKGKTINADSADRLASGLDNVELDDVHSAAKAPLPSKHDTTRYVTFDGIEVTARLAKVDGKDRVAFSVRYVGPAGNEEAGDAKAAAGAKKSGKDAAARARERAGKIEARVRGWVYDVPDYIAGRMEVPLSDLLKDKDKAGPS